MQFWIELGIIIFNLFLVLIEKKSAELIAHLAANVKMTLKPFELLSNTKTTSTIPIHS